MMPHHGVEWENDGLPDAVAFGKTSGSNRDRCTRGSPFLVDAKVPVWDRNGILVIEHRIEVVLFIRYQIPLIEEQD